MNLFKKSQSGKEAKEKNELAQPEKLKYARYYEHDGALRAYANRAMVLAFLCVPTALVAVGLAAYVRLQPPTVIRVDANGEAALLSRGPAAANSPVQVAQGASAEPNDFEKKSFMRLFLEHYLSFSPDNVNRNWADALNMMSSNLRRAILNAMEKDNTVGKIGDEQITAVFQLRSIEASKDDPLSFTAYGVKEIHRVSDHKETTTKLVGKFRIRLISERRTEQNPSGLLIAEFGEELIEGEQRDAVAQGVSFGGPN
jgi:type IV secretory pathway TrbF-like protein